MTWPSHWQSALDPSSPQALQLTALIWAFVGVCTLVWLAVMLALVIGIRRRRRGPAGGPLEPNPRGAHRAGAAVGAALFTTVLIITGLTVISYATTHSIAATDAGALRIRVRGFQWWWEVTYLDSSPDRSFGTANEIHIPVGRTVQLELLASDVIHSFWVPNLMGKQDLIPGRQNQLTFTADQQGIYRGQCAEFCGLQHAHMALVVIVEGQPAFDHWREQQIAPAAAAATPEQEAGRNVFTAKQCGACHAVRGTSASGRLGPDLTHVGGRDSIAAGLLPTSRGSLAAWIADPQGIKPGNNMPMVPLSADELKQVSAYLAALQ